MNKKKVFKIIGIILGALLTLLLCLYAYANYLTKLKHIPEGEVFTNSVDYINPEEALLNDGFEVCYENYIYQYYNPQSVTYSEGKNGLRKYILSNYKNKNYADSGYLNIRFVVNCKGEAGRYITHENDLNLEPNKFNEDLKNQLFKITSQLQEWNPSFIRNEFRDSYMYISYRIENGEITEILP